jgi:hypothetical protein
MATVADRVHDVFGVRLVAETRLVGFPGTLGGPVVTSPAGEEGS